MRGRDKDMNSRQILFSLENKEFRLRQILKIALYLDFFLISVVVI